MNLLSVILIGLSTNLDNFCMAVALGAQRKRLSIMSNFLISLISGIVSYIASKSAEILMFSSLAATLGGVFVVGIGLYTIYAAFCKNGQPDMKVNDLNLRQTLLMGFVLALNCLPVAFGAGAMGLSSVLTSIFIAAFSFASMHIGIWVGKKADNKINALFVNIVSGALLVLLGIIQLAP